MLAMQTFPSCPGCCACDDYIWRQGRLWCPACKCFCTETLEYPIPPAPFAVDGDGWYYRPLRANENPAETDTAAGVYGFVSTDKHRLYMRDLRHDPHPANPAAFAAFMKEVDATR